MVEVQVQEILDNEENEVIVKIICGNISLLAFCHPFVPPKHSEGILLYSLFEKNIRHEPHFELPQKTEDGIFSYHLVAKVISNSQRLVEIDDVKIVLNSNIPNDIPLGAYVSFDVQRLDY